MSALSKAGLDVQALGRSTRLAPSQVCVRKVDYMDEEQLISALKGQDAVISCLGDTASAVSAQRALIEASIKAGVKRFLPSEFGSDTSCAYVRSLPFFRSKIEHQDVLKSAAMQCPNFSYTILYTGLFLDWCLSTVPCIINCGSRTADVYDGGNLNFSVTRTTTVAEAVLRILQRPEQTKNKTLRVHEMILTQNELIQRAEALTTTLPPFSIRSIDTATYEAYAWRAHANPRAEPLEWLVPFINLSIWSQTQPGRFEHVDNALLDIEVLEDPRRAHVIEAELRQATLKLYNPSL
ncbi:hypothetical protein AMS68_001831 [Peltaster fructicola]|uniref:NmrA-like domain-containing protein n=1 Tax=Peltaster fructicola TaxID=286661 RepID=A0A6H0XNL7_9PEZI|nr:hypothetical protein AMS68_001831 [Peltaster fructicola]